MSEVRIDRAGTEAEQTCHLMDIARLAGLDDQRDSRSLLRADQVLLNRRYGKKRRNRHMVLIDSAVRQNDDVISLCVRSVDADLQLLESLLKRCILIVQDRNDLRPKSRLIKGLDLQKVHACKDRVVDLHDAAVRALLLEKVSVGADVDGRICDNLLTERVDRRVRDLREQLLEVIEQRLVLLGEDRKRNIVSHGCCRLDAIGRHRKNRVVDILVGIAEDLVESCSHFPAVLRNLLVRDLDIAEVQQVLVKPLAIRRSLCVVLLALLVRDDSLLLCVDQKDSARHEA